MIWIAIAIFVLTLVLFIAGYFLFAGQSAEVSEIKKRLSLLELRNLRDAEMPAVLKSELLSDIPALNVLLSRMNIAVWIGRKLEQADLNMKVGTFFLLSFVLLGAGMVAGRLLHWPFLVSAILGLLLFFVPNTYVNVKRRIRHKKFMIHFPEALEMFARSLRAGHSFTGAIQLVSQEMPDPISPEFQKVFDEQNLGIPLRQALNGMAERVDALDVKFFVTAILVQRETGGNLAEIIDKISYVIRERFRVQGQLRIFTAQAKMTGFILTLLPIGVAVAIGLLNPDYLKPLWFDPIGKYMIVLAVVMQAVGAIVIRKIIRIKI